MVKFVSQTTEFIQSLKLLSYINTEMCILLLLLIIIIIY